MGRYKTYNQTQLLDAVEKYFATITRQVPVTEMVATGQRDDKGHMIYEPARIQNSLGEDLLRTEYIEPPTIGGMCEYLGISTTTWEKYCKEKPDGKMSPAARLAKDKILAYLQREMLTRPGKDTRGIEFNLRVNYGMDMMRREERDTEELEKVDALLKEFRDAVKPKTN